MMHQKIDPFARKSHRPKRAAVIHKDEITSLVIDLNILSPEDVEKKYFRLDRKKISSDSNNY